VNVNNCKQFSSKIQQTHTGLQGFTFESLTAILQDILVARYNKYKCKTTVNPLESRGNYSATSNNMNLVHWSSMAGLLHLVQQGWNWVGSQPAQAPLHCTKCNSPPIDDQCNNHRIVVQWSVTLQFSCTHKRLIRVAQYNKMNDKKITYRLSR